MDILSILGLALAAVAVFGGAIAKGSGIAALMDIAAFTIVVVGTVAAGFIQTRLPNFLHALRLLRWFLVPPKVDTQDAINRILDWSQIARKEGLLGLEIVAEQETDDFALKGLQLLVDGSEPETIRNILEVDLNTKESHDLAGAKVWEAMGIYAPTLGIIGAVMGLIAVMKKLDDPSALGSGIATAFVATIYGIASANLFFLPVSAKIKSLVEEQTTYREMMIDGLVSIADGENPRNIETKLNCYVK
jgi:chemotaxis protein MotA